MFIETIHWHTLHPRYLNSQSVALNIGANYGQFSERMMEIFSCHCIAVEPSPVPYEAIPDVPAITKIQAAVAGRSGKMPFHVSSDSVASSLMAKDKLHERTIDIDVFSLKDLAARLGLERIDLLKMDIEGAEIEALAACDDAFLSKIGQMTIEFHDFCGLTTPEEVRATLKRLEQAGFFSVRMSGVGHQDTWLINRDMHEISTAELQAIRHVVRNSAGLKRVVARRLGALNEKFSPAKEHSAK